MIPKQKTAARRRCPTSGGLLMFVLSYSTGCLSDPCRIALYGAGSPARDRTDDKQRSDSQCNGDQEGYEPVVNQRCDEVADKRYACYGHGVKEAALQRDPHDCTAPPPMP